PITASWSYCYDANGNRTYDSTSTAPTVACPGQPGGPAATYTYDPADALIARAGTPAGAFSYDGNGAELTGAGATTRTGASWNPRGQLTSLTSNGTTTPFSYAGEGNKERLTAGGSGYQNTPLGVTTQTGTGASTVIREPGGTPVALRIGGASYYYIADRQGSTISLVDATGAEVNHYSYDPYGNARATTETVPNPWQYIGGQYDTTTGLYHLQARYYDPTLGRFTQPDPSGQEANVYAYAACNSVNSSDPTGLAPNCGLAAAAGGILGGLVGAGLGGFASGGNPVGAAVGAVKGAVSGYEATSAVCNSDESAGGRVLDGVKAYLNVDEP
ncbi:RHS repeat-associated core domain-containing protein, partial [Modestobacter lapidis]|nr:RHS repeat-associated core domain-containing protein [Modestobacter lapidis]